MRGKKLPQGEETKLIAGVPHRKTPCDGCGEPIWVDVMSEKAYCTDCSFGFRPKRGRDDPTYDGNMRYDGNSGNR